MRLIDADEFIKRFCNMCETPTDKAISYIVIGAIESQPTAYNVDSVVEELKEASFYDTYLSEETKVIDRDKAIEIVKAGGKNG